MLKILCLYSDHYCYFCVVYYDVTSCNFLIVKSVHSLCTCLSKAINHIEFPTLHTLKKKKLSTNSKFCFITFYSIRTPHSIPIHVKWIMFTWLYEFCCYNTRVSRMKTLNIFYSLSRTIWCADPWLISRCTAISFTVLRWFSFTMSSTAAMPSGVTTGCAWQGRGESVTELMPFMNFPVHSYTCCSDRQTRITTLNFHSSVNFDGFHPFTT